MDATGYMGSDSEIANWLVFADTTSTSVNPISVDTTASTGMKYDSGKLHYSLIPTQATKALAEVLTFGAAKYAPNSWQTVPDGERRYLDAAMRHLEAYRSGETIDYESGLTHLSHLLCNAAFLVYFENDRLLKEQRDKTIIN